MKRTLMQMYVKNSAAAVEFYQQAFHASLGNNWRNPDGSCAHVELDVEGQILAISEAPDNVVMGNNLQFCLHFNEDEKSKVKCAYDILCEGAHMICDLGEPSWSPYMFALIDRFGVYWCVFI